MKSVLKVGVLAIALGMFIASCNNAGTNNDGTDDSSNVEMSEPAPEAAPETAPTDTVTPAPTDTVGADTSM